MAAVVDMSVYPSVVVAAVVDEPVYPRVVVAAVVDVTNSNYY